MFDDDDDDIFDNNNYGADASGALDEMETATMDYELTIPQRIAVAQVYALNLIAEQLRIQNVLALDQAGEIQDLLRNNKGRITTQIRLALGEYPRP